LKFGVIHKKVGVFKCTHNVKLKASEQMFVSFWKRGIGFTI